ncbi:hypothetical protein D3C75_1132010 [compost metagenome]
MVAVICMIVPATVMITEFFMAFINCPSLNRLEKAVMVQSTGQRKTSPDRMAVLPLKEVASTFSRGKVVATAHRMRNSPFRLRRHLVTIIHSLPSPW